MIVSILDIPQWDRETKIIFFFLEESFSNNDKGFIVTGKSSTYRFDDIGELPSMNMTMMHMESQW